jgi:hypothetical protein
VFETIVVGVDASGHADQAVQTVAKIAAESKDKVVVFHGVAVHHAKGTVYVIEPRDGAQHLVAVMWHSSPAAGVAATGEVHRELATGTAWCAGEDPLAAPLGSAD